MPREVTDDEGIVWSCVAAYQGLSDGSKLPPAARVDGAADRYYVVCTPSGGAKSVRLEVPGDWERACADADLLREIRSQLERDG